MTNGDKIRSMTDEELAKWFAPHMLCKVCDNIAIGCDLADCEKYALAYMQRDCEAETLKRDPPAV